MKTAEEVEWRIEIEQEKTAAVVRIYRDDIEQKGYECGPAYWVFPPCYLARLFGATTEDRLADALCKAGRFVARKRALEEEVYRAVKRASDKQGGV